MSNSLDELITREEVVKALVKIAQSNSDEGGNHAHALKALELLGKHLALFTDKVQIEENSSLASRLEVARRRNEVFKAANCIPEQIQDRF